MPCRLRIFWEGRSLSSACALALDHAFIGCAAGAPEAEALLKLGFVEGSANTHPGQGTANRRFFFDNFMLELVFVTNAAEARSYRTQRTRLWDRLERQEPSVSPFGVIFKPSGSQSAEPPFPTWSYTPAYLPPGLAMLVAEGTSLQEPELFYLPFMNRPRSRGAEPTTHALPIIEILGLSVGVTRLDNLSKASRAAEAQGLLRYFAAPTPLMEIAFTGAAGMRIDLRPGLPLVFCSQERR